MDFIYLWVCGSIRLSPSVHLYGGTRVGLETARPVLWPLMTGALGAGEVGEGPGSSRGFSQLTSRGKRRIVSFFNRLQREKYRQKAHTMPVVAGIFPRV